MVASLDSPYSRRRRYGMDIGKVEQCQHKPRDTIGQYATMISEYFSLHQCQLQIKQTMNGDKCAMPSFVPISANSIYTCEYLTLIIGDLTNCVNNINTTNLAVEAILGLTDLMEKARSNFVDVLCRRWERDAKTFFVMEEWILNPQSPQFTTLLMRYYDYNKFCARTFYRICSLVVIPTDINEPQERIIPPSYIEEVRGSSSSRPKRTDWCSRHSQITHH